jgi:hypothetical protein
VKAVHEAKTPSPRVATAGLPPARVGRCTGSGGTAPGVLPLRTDVEWQLLKSQRQFAQRAVPHAQRIRPPIEVVVAHYWNK